MLGPAIFLRMATIILFNPLVEWVFGYILLLQCRNSMLQGRDYVQVIRSHLARVLENLGSQWILSCAYVTFLWAGNMSCKIFKKRILTEETVYMTLVMLNHNHHMHCLVEWFHHSLETICRNIHEVLCGFYELGKHLIHLIRRNEVHPKIYTDRRFVEWFVVV